jgi:hypothetical protein
LTSKKYREYYIKFVAIYHGWYVFNLLLPA